MVNLAKHLSEVSRETVNNVDISHGISRVNQDFIEYYTALAGSEHYRLLGYLSSLMNDSVFLDVGTFRGYSAIALSQNQSNRVVSYDIEKCHNHENDGNVEYRIGEAIDFENFGGTSVIVLDTFHDGVYEEKFINHLRSIGWSGTLIMDDIHHFPELQIIYDKLAEEKYDITSIGHWSGTGVISFG